MSDTVNSFTRYYNILSERKGPLFLPQFQSRQILSDEQLLHTSRYIHLNPFTSRLVQQVEDLQRFPHSSFKEYIYQSNKSLINTSILLKYFNNKRESYKKFVLNNAYYQQKLHDSE